MLQAFQNYVISKFAVANAAAVIIKTWIVINVD